MPGEPTFRIDGAEIFLKSDEKTSSVYYLTNSRNIKNLSDKENLADEERIDFSRLISPSFVKTVTTKELRKLNSLSIMKR